MYPDRRITNRARVLILAVVFVLTACTNNPIRLPGSVDDSPGADPRLSRNSNFDFFTRSGLEACVIGGVGGILICELTASKKDKGTCRIAAAIIGCGVGVGTDVYLNHQRDKYANREQRLRAMTDDVRKDNERLQGLTSTAREVMKDDRASMEKLRRDIRSKQVSNEEARKKLDEIDANRAYLEKTVTDLKKRLTEWRDIASKERKSGVRVDTMNAEINKMQNQVASLESEIDQLYQQRSAIKIG